jgi:hypothetical protein
MAAPVAVSLALLGGVAAAEDPPPRLRAGALSGALHVDAVFDEPDWAAAPPIEGFTMVEPTQGGIPTTRERSTPSRSKRPGTPRRS